jgi:predicted Rossmann fold flavoprotein
VESVARVGEGFRVSGPSGSVDATRLVLATGGRSLPKTGSDGGGYALARGLGHSVSAVFPGLVPLTLRDGHVLRELSGVSAVATLEVRAASGRRLKAFTDSTLCTHFGLSGPSVLDVSRYLAAARRDDPGAVLVANWVPSVRAADVEAGLRDLGAGTPVRLLSRWMPERLARAVCVEAAVDPSVLGARLTREARRALVRAATEMVLPVTGDRGFNYAEVTAGGVPLAELDLQTLESRVCPGLFLVGEICDVDGRVGGFNFQWAWASGYVAGVSVGSRSI